MQSNDNWRNAGGKLALAAIAICAGLLALVFSSGRIARVDAQTGAPEVLDKHLELKTVVTGLMSPTTMAFIGDDDFLVLEKNTGLVRRVVDGVLQGNVLDLNVNFFSERGLLGIAVDPQFETNGFVYLYWTQSTVMADTNVPANTPHLGNRVDRYHWNGSTLAFERNLIMIRAIQQDAGQPERGNHDGGVLAFGPDGKLYIFIGDLGRRGNLQNLPCGPTATCPGPIVPDDQFGGPQPDNSHLSGVVLRLNSDGTTPTDNPFFGVGAGIPGEVGLNIQKIFSYGHRNSFGMAFDPDSGDLWLQENGDDSFSELNRVTAGQNGGWVQVMGPIARVAQFKQIETTFGGQNLQQLRWPPTNIANTPQEARSRLFVIPGSHYSDPEFSWLWEVAPGGIGFVDGKGLGGNYKGDLFVGAGTPILEGGYLFHFRLAGNRERINVNDPGLNDRVADNLAKHEITESESLLIGRNFGVVSDIETGPDGKLYLVSLTRGTIYQISRDKNNEKNEDDNDDDNGKKKGKGRGKNWLK